MMLSVATGKKRVLVVEDDPISARALSRLLELAGFEVSRAATVIEATKKLVHAPDWLVLDLDLPDGDGGDVLAAVRQRDLDAGVIITTGSGDKTIVLKAMSLGPDVMLEKPIEINQLLRCLYRPRTPFAWSKPPE